MQRDRLSRKAAGSSDHEYDNSPHNSSSSASKASGKGKKPQAHLRRSEADDQVQPFTTTAVNTTEQQRRTSAPDNTSDDWDVIDRPEQPHSPSSRSTSYQFPGTWPAAYHDTTTALSQVTSATASYASALTKSGIGTASWSIGSALASTANSGAYSLASWAVESTGTGYDQLPRPIGRWMKNKKEKEDEKRRACNRRLSRRSGRLQAGEPQTFGDERGAFVLETAEMDSTGEIVGPMRPVFEGVGRRREEEERWRMEKMRGGGVEGEGEMEGVGDDEEEMGEEEKGDGLVRLFEFDD